MLITEVVVTPVRPKEGLIAIASVVIDGNIYLNSIAVYTKLDGSYRLLYPTKSIGNRSLAIFHPINRGASKTIEKAIFKKCNEIFKGCNENDRYSQNKNTL